MTKKTINTYRDLKVWQKSMALVISVYTFTKSFPKDELYGLTPQLRRCAVSIPANIAEGYGRNSTKDYVRFLRITMGSLFELQTLLEISGKLDLLGKEGFSEKYEYSREVERMLSSLIRKVSST